MSLTEGDYPGIVARDRAAFARLVDGFFAVRVAGRIVDHDIHQQLKKHLVVALKSNRLVALSEDD